MSQAAFQTSPRAASISVAMSASLNWIAWNDEIGRPNWCARARRRRRGRRRPARAPTPIAATEMRPPSRIWRNWWKPWPRAPSRFPLGHGAVGERERPRVGRLPAHLVQRLGDLVPGRAVLDHEVRDLALAGQRRDRHALRDVGAGVRDEDLGAVDDPAAVVAGRRRARRAGVGARLGLGEAERGEPLAAGERGDPALLLLVGAEQVDRHRAERGVRGERDRDRRVDARELLDRDRVGERVAARAAELLGERDAHQPELGHLGDELVREPASRSSSSATGATRSTANARTVSRKSSCSGERSKSTRGDRTRRASRARAAWRSGPRLVQR